MALYKQMIARTMRLSQDKKQVLKNQVIERWKIL
jgi:hypothetical protein